MLKFSQYQDHPLIEVGKTSGHEINAVRVRNPDGSIRYTRRFQDSRLADHALHEAVNAMGEVIAA
jgi:hypothetical protein